MLIHYPWFVRRSMWLILVDLLSFLRDSLSWICSPFNVTLSRWSVRHSSWFIMVNLFAIYVTHSPWSVRHSRDSFSLIYSPFYVTHFPGYLLIANVIPSAVLVKLRLPDIINLTNVNFQNVLYRKHKFSLKISLTFFWFTLFIPAMFKSWGATLTCIEDLHVISLFWYKIIQIIK